LGPADAEVVQAADVAQRHASCFVDLVLADSVVCVGGAVPAWGRLRPGLVGGGRCHPAREGAARGRWLLYLSRNRSSRVGVHQTRVSHWERGSRAPSADHLQAHADVFDEDIQTVVVAEFFVENDVERALIQDPLLRDDDRHALLTLYKSVTRKAIAGG
jgi:helix-turn-helix protein